MGSPDAVPALPEPPHKPRWHQLSFPRIGTPPKEHRNPVVEGWDTETENGYATLMANSGAWWPVRGLHDALPHLCGRSARGAMNVWWNMDYDVRCLLKWDPELLEAVYTKGKGEVPGYRVRYLKGKLLVVRGGSGQVGYHYDAYSFYSTGLEKAVEKYLGRKAHALKAERADLSRFTLAQRGEYCQQDATDTRDLARLFLGKLHELGCYPRRLISPGNVAATWARQRGDIPTWLDFPPMVNRAAWWSFRGGWVDLWQRGALTVWKYDLNSAYPWVLRQLPDPLNGTWVREVAREAVLGFVRVVVRDAREAPPFLAAWGGSSLLYPHVNGPVRAWVTLPEFRVLERLAQVEVESAWTFSPGRENVPPYQWVVDRLLRHKAASKGDSAAYHVAKVMVNSLYGKTAQRTPDEDAWLVGKTFCAPYAAMCTGWTRALAAEAVATRPRAVVSLATDSVAATRPLRLKVGEDLGQWKVEAEGKPGVFVMPGVYEVDGERAHYRGFRLTRPLREVLDTDAQVAQVGYTRPWGAREALRQKKVEKVGVFEERPRDLTLRNTRRLWPEAPAQMRDLLRRSYASAPVPWTLLAAWLTGGGPGGRPVPPGPGRPAPPVAPVPR